MIKFFGLLCLVGLASACCMVSKWEAFEGFTVGASKEGQGSYTEGGLWLSYDEDRKMMNTFLSESTDGKARKVRVFRTTVRDDFPCTEGLYITPRYEGRRTYLVGNDKRISVLGVSDNWARDKETLSLNYRATEISLHIDIIHVHIQYTLDELTSKCTKMKLPTSFQKACVPAGAKLVGNQYFGAPSSDFNVDVYKIPNLKGLEGYLLVTQNGCIPVSEGLHGEIAEKSYAMNGKEFRGNNLRHSVDVANTLSGAIFDLHAYGVVGASFSNYTEGIKSASVFEVPTECQNATVRPYDGPPTLTRLFF